MKTTTYIIAILATVTATFANPFHKNYKPWVHHKNTSVGVASVKVENDHIGPQLKNAKAWEAEGHTVYIENSERLNHQGPQAKNFKSFRK